MITLLLASVLISMPLVPPEVNTPEALSIYMRKNYTYKSDGMIDDWQTPQETAKKKTGDCEDWAFLVEKVLSQLGYEVQPIWINGYAVEDGKRVKYSHAVCIVKVEKGYRYFSNQYYSYFKTFVSVQEIIEWECPDWRWFAKIALPHRVYDKHYKAESE